MLKKPRAAELTQQSHASQPDTSVHYTVPNGLSFMYRDNKLCFMDKEEGTLYTLKEDVAPPTTGLRAQFIWGTQSSCSTASVPEAEATCTCSDNTNLEAAGQLMHKTCLQDMPDSILQLIGQQLCNAIASPDAIAASMLACTGSRALLIMAHAIWALLEPDSVKPDKHVQRLRQAHSETTGGSLEPSQQEHSAVHVSDKQGMKLEATAALCVLGDPLQCPLSPKVQQSLAYGHRRNVANKLLHQHNLQVSTLPIDCGIPESMIEWMNTGYLDGIKQHSTMAVSEIAMRCSRLEQLETAGRGTANYNFIAHRAKLSTQWKEYVTRGICAPADIIAAEVDKFLDEIADKIADKVMIQLRKEGFFDDIAEKVKIQLGNTRFIVR